MGFCWESCWDSCLPFPAFWVDLLKDNTSFYHIHFAVCQTSIPGMLAETGWVLGTSWQWASSKGGWWSAGLCLPELLQQTEGSDASPLCSTGETSTVQCLVLDSPGWKRWGPTKLSLLRDSDEYEAIGAFDIQGEAESWDCPACSRGGSGKSKSGCMNTWGGRSQALLSGAQGLAKRQWAQTGIKEILLEYKKKKINYCEGDWTLEETPQRDWGVSKLGGTQNPSE